MEALPELYSIIHGEVASVREYGAFVKLPGLRKHGLVHVSHMCSTRVENPAEVVDVGEKVWCKVISLEDKDDGKGMKIALSMKVVNQGTGKDLDPANVGLEQDERRKRKFRDFSADRIQLGAVLNTTCSKCGCKGHFTKDCFSLPGGTKYDLIPDDGGGEAKAASARPVSVPRGVPLDSANAMPISNPRKAPAAPAGAAAGPGLAAGPVKKRKKDKEKKLKKKKKKRSKETSSSSSSSSSSDDDSDSDDSDDGRRHKRKKRKVEKKKKKKSHKKKHSKERTDKGGRKRRSSRK